MGKLGWVVMCCALGWVDATGARAGAATDAAIEAMQDYMMFAEDEAGVILPRQVDQGVFEAAVFIDTRSDDQRARGGVPGAVPIGWREVLERIDEIPQDRMTILYCETGIQSAQAVFALRVAGRSNALVLQGGYQGWLADAGWRP
jgi:rhodanese-related sulfurtransferase